MSSFNHIKSYFYKNKIINWWKLARSVALLCSNNVYEWVSVYLCFGYECISVYFPSFILLFSIHTNLYYTISTLYNIYLHRTYEMRSIALSSPCVYYMMMTMMVYGVWLYCKTACLLLPNRSYFVRFVAISNIHRFELCVCCMLCSLALYVWKSVWIVLQKFSCIYLFRRKKTSE